MTQAQNIIETLKVVPPIAVCSATSLFGITLSGWVQVATIFFICFQVVVSLYKLARDERGRRYE